MREALTRADLVVTTGGLGPTSDDLTRDRIAQMLGRNLREDAALLAHIQAFFTRRKRAMPDKVRVQALVPEGTMVLPNPNGTAPGLAIEVRPNPFRADKGTSWLVMLPGPPRELRPMFSDSVIPLLKRVLPPESEYVCRTLRTAGLPESLVEERIDGPLKPLVDAGLDLGYCARIGQVDVRLAAGGAGARQIVSDAEAIVRRLLGERIYADDDDELETVVVRLLTERKLTLAVAESCTGGNLANRLTNVTRGVGRVPLRPGDLQQRGETKAARRACGHTGAIRCRQRGRRGGDGRRSAAAKRRGFWVVHHRHRRSKRRLTRKAGWYRVHRFGRPGRNDR